MTGFEDVVPFRILSLRGGGLRGVVAAAFLTRLEELGKQEHGPQYLLAHSFDLVGGTSTGAVIAAAVALGFEACDIVDFYLVRAPQVFRRRYNRLPLLQPLFCRNKLYEHYASQTLGRRLEPSDLLTHLAITSRNFSIMETYIFSSIPNPSESALGVRFESCPLDIAELLTAATATPYYFAPARLASFPGRENDLWIDGGLSLFNDASRLLLEYRPLLSANGRRVPTDLLSVGTGKAQIGSPKKSLTTFSNVTGAIQGVVADCEAHWLRDLTQRHLDDADGQNRLSYANLEVMFDYDFLDRFCPGMPSREALRMLNPSDPRNKRVLFSAVRDYASQHLKSALPIAQKHRTKFVDTINTTQTCRPSERVC